MRNRVCFCRGHMFAWRGHEFIYIIVYRGRKKLYKKRLARKSKKYAYFNLKYDTIMTRKGATPCKKNDEKGENNHEENLQLLS